MQKLFVCPYCHSNIKQGAGLIICPACETPHHKECWIENNGCTSFGCKENPETKNHLKEKIELQNNPVTQNTFDTTDIPEIFPCPNCANDIEEGSSYCKHCGYKLIKINEEEKSEDFEKEFKDLYSQKVKFHRNRLILLYSGIFLFIGIIVFGLYKISDFYMERFVTEHIQIDRKLNDWRKAWESKNIEEYGNFLSAKYKYTGSDGKTINKETKLKRIEATFNRYKIINIRFSNVNISTVKLNPPIYKITYNENYESDKFKSEGKTTLLIVKENDEYKITEEIFK